MERRCWVGMCKFVSILAFLATSGCANWQINQLASELPSQGPQSTLQKLEAIQPRERDRVQYLLNRGLLKFYSGDILGSQQDLQEAKEIMDALQSLSVTENLAATTTNETLRSYKGSPSERVLVHVVLARRVMEKAVMVADLSFFFLKCLKVYFVFCKTRLPSLLNRSKLKLPCVNSLVVCSISLLKPYSSNSF